MHQLIKKVLLGIGILLIFFLVLRPIRGDVISFIDSRTTYHGLDYGFVGATSINMVSLNNSEQKEMYFKAPFGMFFLFAVMGLLFVGFTVRNTLLLAGLHSSIWILAFISFKIGVAESLLFLDIMDFLAGYLLPLCTMGAYTYASSNETIKTNKF